MPNQSNKNVASMAAPKTNSKLDPKTQEIFDMFIINGMELIYDEKQAKSMLPRLSANEDPTKAMAEVLVGIITRVTTSAKSAGKKIPPEVILTGGNFLFGELLKVLETAGMEPMSEEQKTGVWQTASSIYIDQAVQSGEMTEQELMALSEEVKQTTEGKKVMQTAEDPEAAAQGLKKPEMEKQTSESVGLAAPSQGGI